MKRGLPIAATRMSARAHTDARSRVREWHSVTVASATDNSSATGLPTTGDRPTTTTLAPASGTTERDRASSSTAAAVAGANAGVPCASRPNEYGFDVSTSLPTTIASQ